MALVSPGVEIKEKDRTLVVQQVSSTTGGIAGRFKNGPINVPVLVSSEAQLAEVFGKPDDSNYPEWFSAAEFLKYSGALYAVRAAASDTRTAVQKSGAPSIVFKSQEDFEEKLNTVAGIASGTYGLWGSRLAGNIGNSIAVLAIDAGNWTDFQTWAAINKTKYGIDLATVFAQPPKTSPWLQDKLVNGKNAKFSVTTSNGAVTSPIVIVNGGEGYKQGAYLEFNGAGTGASASVTVNDGVLTKISLTNAGSGYTGTPTASISAPADVGGVTATASVTQVGGFITAVNITNGGKGYTASDTITVTISGAGSLATAVVPSDSIKNGVISSVTVTSGGTGYGTSAVTATAFSKSADDEVHVLVIDVGGKVSGTENSVLEMYEGLSKIVDARNTFGTDNYYMTTVNNNSKYVYWLKSPATGTLTFELLAGGSYAEWDSKFADAQAVLDTGLSFRKFVSVFGDGSSWTPALKDGADGSTVTDGQVKDAYSLLANTDQYDIACFPTGGFSIDVIKHVIENVAYERKDAMAFVSPYSARESDLSTNKYVLLKTANDIVNFKNIDLAVADMYAQYSVMDSGWKYVFDKYNNKYRWVPMNGDIAGVVARLELVSEPWFSPGGYDRGGVKNVLKLAFNPSQAERDVLYPKGINPVVVLPAGGGTMLYGDRTMTSKPSAFDRINVRRLFNILEKSVGQMAKYKLFEINDSFTRSDFKSKVDGYLRDVQGRRGITEFLTVCDSTNNTGDVIDRNEFRADIYIKPTRSINFITLSFVATSTGVAFSTVVGS